MEPTITTTNVKYIIREPIAGDMGIVVYQNAILYSKEYGWNNEYEALCLEITAKFIREFEPKCEKCFIAEVNGKVVGSIFLIRFDETTSKIRLFYVDESARGLGIGAKLIDECIKFSKQCGYKKITLWTNSLLLAARKLYHRAGFKLINEEASHSFGKDLIFQTLTKDL